MVSGANYKIEFLL